jgi:S-formylglutathione hydrolase FrmB
MRVLLLVAFLLFQASFAVASDLSYRQFASPALNGQIPAMVYAPDGKPPEGGWPVLYLLHGHDGNEHSWVDLGHIQQTLDGMIATRQIDPLLVVMPGGGNGWYVDSEDVGGPGDFATAIAVDLPTAIEAGYAVRRDRGGRAIAGLSMGGFGAVRLALLNPGRYVATASLSGAIWNNIPPADFSDTVEQLALIQETDYFHRVDPDTVTVGRVLPSVGTHFGGVFGVPFDPARFDRDNIFTILDRQIAAKANLPAIYLTCGDDDSFNLWRGAMALFETARADRLTDVQLRITDGDHVWSLWSTTIVDALLFIDKRWIAPGRS